MPKDKVDFSKVRKGVTSKKEEVWKHRNDKDVYTLRVREDVEKNTPEVDHIIEIQIHKSLLARVEKKGTVAVRTRAGIDAYAEIINSTPCLNVTTKKINQAKKGPFTSFLNRYDGSKSLRGKSVDDLLKNREMRDSGTWDRIKKSVVTTWYDHTEKELKEKTSEAFSSAFIEEMGVMMESMKLE